MITNVSPDHFRLPACPLFIQTIDSKQKFTSFDISGWLLKQNYLNALPKPDKISTLLCQIFFLCQNGMYNTAIL